MGFEALHDEVPIIICLVFDNNTQHVDVYMLGVFCS